LTNFDDIKKRHLIGYSFKKSSLLSYFHNLIEESRLTFVGIVASGNVVSIVGSGNGVSIVGSGNVVGFVGSGNGVSIVGSGNVVGFVASGYVIGNVASDNVIGIGAFLGIASFFQNIELVVKSPGFGLNVRHVRMGRRCQSKLKKVF
jgi:hypothetical protein